MWRSLLLKEWLKLRWYFMAALVLNLGVCIKILLDVRHRMRIEHAEMDGWFADQWHWLALLLLPALLGAFEACRRFQYGGAR